MKHYEHGAPPPGYAYMLDFTQYELVFTHQLVACNGDRPPNQS
ncbi:hypothetical protein [Stenotrophomonas sp. PS02297]|nr:hypothetical protein [Stenotrophomonas sp. PS02297]